MELLCLFNTRDGGISVAALGLGKDEGKVILPLPLLSGLLHHGFGTRSLRGPGRADETRCLRQIWKIWGQICSRDFNARFVRIGVRVLHAHQRPRFPGYNLNLFLFAYFVVWLSVVTGSNPL